MRARKQVRKGSSNSLVDRIANNPHLDAISIDLYDKIDDRLKYNDRFNYLYLKTRSRYKSWILLLQATIKYYEK